MGKIENSLLYQMFVLGGASSGNVPEKANPYLPDAADGYTEYADIAELTVSDIRNCGIGSTLNAKIALNTGIAVGDKVLLTGRILNSGSDVVLYAVWGTVDYYHDYKTYSRVRFVVVGSSIRPFTGDTVTINSNGTTNVFGASKVVVNVESVQTEPLYVNENGDYYPESGYAYGEVHVDVQGGSEPNLQSKVVTVTQNGTQTIEPDSGYDGLSDVALTVNVSGGGTVEAEEKDVNFIDYDGTILYSYTADEFVNELSALPANPSHAGLTAQGWNWTLSDAQSYVANNGMLWIGQMYITDDGKTRLYIRLDDELRMSPTLQFKQSSKGVVTVDWGDGSAPETDANNLTVAMSHTYAALGDYVITLERSGSATYTLGGSDETSGRENLGLFAGTVYEHILRKVEIGAGVSDIATTKWIFRYYMELETITIPNTTLFKNTDYLFAYCMSLKALVVPNSSTVVLGIYLLNSAGAKRVSLPKTATTPSDTYCYQFFGSVVESLSLPSTLRVGTNPFSYVVIPVSFAFGAYNLRKVVIPEGVKTISKTAFKNCHSVSEFVVPSSVTTINSCAFEGCRGVEEYHFKATTPPTLEATDVFKYIPDDAIIYVPYNGLHTVLNAYKKATNWSTYASKIQEEPQ